MEYFRFLPRFCGDICEFRFTFRVLLQQNYDKQGHFHRFLTSFCNHFSVPRTESVLAAKSENKFVKLLVQQGKHYLIDKFDHGCMHACLRLWSFKIKSWGHLRIIFSVSTYHTPESDSKFANIWAKSRPNSKTFWGVNLGPMGHRFMKKREFWNLMRQSLKDQIC